MRVGIGPVWPDVWRVAVLRGGGLGDLLFAVAALTAAYPEAGIVLLGVPAFARLLADRPVSVDRVVTIPTTLGVYEAGGAADWAAFAAEVGPVDLGVQLHGGGRNSSPFVLRLAEVGGRVAHAGRACADAVVAQPVLPGRGHAGAGGRRARRCGSGVRGASAAVTGAISPRPRPPSTGCPIRR